MKLSTNTIIIALGAVILGFLALITIGLLVAPFSAKPVDSQTTVQAIVVQTMAALQNVPISIPQTGITSPTPTLRPIGGSSLTVAMLQNTQYHSKTWGDYQLADGIFYRPTSAPGETPELYSTQLYLPTFGDLNSDGVDDAAVILITQNGGNGSSKELAIVLAQGDTIYNVATVDLGFMVAVDKMQVQSGTVTLDVRVLGPNDGLCCPSQLETWHFRLENNQLVQTP